MFTPRRLDIRRRMAGTCEKGFGMEKTLRWYREWVYALLLSLGRMARTLISHSNKFTAHQDSGGQSTRECSYCSPSLDKYARVCQFCGALL
jgi:hypothetical protein